LQKFILLYLKLHIFSVVVFCGMLWCSVVFSCVLL